MSRYDYGEYAHGTKEANKQKKMKRKKLKWQHTITSLFQEVTLLMHC